MATKYHNAHGGRRTRRRRSGRRQGTRRMSRSKTLRKALQQMKAASFGFH